MTHDSVTNRWSRSRRPLSLSAWILISIPVTAVAFLLVMIEARAGHGTYYLAVLLYAVPVLVSGVLPGGAAGIGLVALAFAELPLVVLALRAAGPGRRRWRAAGGLLAAHVLAIILVAARGTLS